MTKFITKNGKKIPMGKSNKVMFTAKQLVIVKQSKPDVWVNGVPLAIAVDNHGGGINVSSVRFNKDEKRYFHDQHIISANEYPDSTGHQNKLHDEFAQDWAKKYNGGKEFKNTKADYLKLAKIANRKSGISLGAYKQRPYGKTQEELKKMGVPT